MLPLWPTQHIHRLPEAVINKLKAGEIVERPASALKELIENALDAWATQLTITLAQWGKNLIKIQDNGSWISAQDMDLVLERYATSKIQSESDLFVLSSYGFRGEALASISEVSHLTLQSKTQEEHIAISLDKKDERLVKESVPVAFDHGTIVYVRDLFFNVPVRRRFLKTEQTEYKYCLDIVKQFALLHPDKQRTLVHNDKTIMSLSPTDDITQRIADLYKKDRSDTLHVFDHVHEWFAITGIIGDAGMRFSHQRYMQRFVNERPVNDKIIKKASLDALRRELHPHEYPFLLLFITCDPDLLDVNVHPRKTQVTFLQPWQVYTLVQDAIKSHLSTHKITTSRTHETTSSPFPSSLSQLSHTSSHSSSSIPSSHQSAPNQSSYHTTRQAQQHSMFATKNVAQIYQSAGSIVNEKPETIQFQQQDYIIIWQLRKTYIVLEAEDSLMYIDQHAMAERIAFEKLLTKAEWQTQQTHQLLQAQTLDMPETITETQLQSLEHLWRDVSLLWDKKLAIYGVPEVLYDIQLDLEKAINHIFAHDTSTLTQLLEDLFATRACKASIKAWQKLSLTQITSLLHDGLHHIPWWFVCQHGRPFALAIPKNTIDKMFDRT